MPCGQTPFLCSALGFLWYAHSESRAGSAAHVPAAHESAAPVVSMHASDQSSSRPCARTIAGGFATCVYRSKRSSQDHGGHGATSLSNRDLWASTAGGGSRALIFPGLTQTHLHSLAPLQGENSSHGGVESRSGESDSTDGSGGVVAVRGSVRKGLHTTHSTLGVGVRSSGGQALPRPHRLPSSLRAILHSESLLHWAPVRSARLYPPLSALRRWGALYWELALGRVETERISQSVACLSVPSPSLFLFWPRRGRK